MNVCIPSICRFNEDIDKNHTTHWSNIKVSVFVFKAKILNRDDNVNRQIAIIASFFKIHKITNKMSTTKASSNESVDIDFVRKDFDPKLTLIEFVAFMKNENTINIYKNNQAFRTVLISEIANIADANYTGKTQQYDQLMHILRELKTIESFWNIKQSYEREKNVVDGYEKVYITN